MPPTYLRTDHQLLRTLIIRGLMLERSASVDCATDDTTLTDSTPSWREGPSSSASTSPTRFVELRGSTRAAFEFALASGGRRTSSHERSLRSVLELVQSDDRGLSTWSWWWAYEATCEALDRRGTRTPSTRSESATQAQVRAIYMNHEVVPVPCD